MAALHQLSAKSRAKRSWRPGGFHIKYRKYGRALIEIEANKGGVRCM